MYLPSYVFLRVTFCVVILNIKVKTQQYFVSSSDVFLDKKTLFEIWVNPGLNLTIFRKTGRRSTGKENFIQPNWRAQWSAEFPNATRLC